MSNPLVEYFRCPEHFAQFNLRGDLSADSGYFKFGADTTCYGQLAGTSPAPQPTGQLHDALPIPALRLVPSACRLKSVRSSIAFAWNSIAAYSTITGSASIP